MSGKDQRIVLLGSLMQTTMLSGLGQSGQSANHPSQTFEGSAVGRQGPRSAFRAGSDFRSRSVHTHARLNRATHNQHRHRRGQGVARTQDRLPVLGRLLRLWPRCNWRSFRRYLRVGVVSEIPVPRAASYRKRDGSDTHHSCGRYGTLRRSARHRGH